MIDHVGPYSLEQDSEYEGEWINCNTKWAATKKVLTSNWTIYEMVKPRADQAAYQTPVFQFKSEKEARTKMDELRKAYDKA